MALCAQPFGWLTLVEVPNCISLAEPLHTTPAGRQGKYTPSQPGHAWLGAVS